MNARQTKLLSVEGLTTTFSTDDGVLNAVDDVSFEVLSGEVLGIVGESGCGKTVACKSIMRLIPDPPGRITGGKVLFKGEDLAVASRSRMEKIRGNHIAMIFQEPMTALNPVLTVGWQLEEALVLHQRLEVSERRAKVLNMLKKVGIPSPERRLREYPHQLSGGMRQRVMIAMALACNPEILIADEPTTALDVTIQAQVLRLMTDLRDSLDTAIILITHDLGVVAELCDRVLVMYAARVVEQGSVDDIFHRPAHPYTKALLRSLPRLERRQRDRKLETIAGMVPDLKHLRPGCRFYERCPKAQDDCRAREPNLVQLDGARNVRCFHPEDQS